MRVALQAACLGLSACAAPKIKLSETEIREGLIGTWVSIRKEGAEEIQLDKTFLADGWAEGTIALRRREQSSWFHFPVVTFRDRWRVIGDIIETSGIQSNSPDAFPAGTVLQDRLIKLTAGSAEFIDLTHGNKGLRFTRKNAHRKAS